MSENEEYYREIYMKDPAYKACWISAVDALLKEQELNGYKKGWCYDRLAQSPMPPSLEAWEYLAFHLEYKQDWARKQYAKWWERKTGLADPGMFIGWKQIKTKSILVWR